MPITQTFTLISDIQEHEEEGEPISGATRFSEHMVSVTIRSAQQTLFAHEILDQILKRNNTPIVILGDVLDVSCETEWNRVSARLNRANTAWVIAPGNHDGFYMGNFSPTTLKYQPLFGRQGWDARCRRADRSVDGYDIPPGNGPNLSFTKAQYIEKYLQALAASKASGLSDSVKNCLKYTGQKTHECHSDDPKTFLQDIVWKGAHSTNNQSDPYYKAFVLQRINISLDTKKPHATLYLLDTAQYQSPCSSELCYFFHPSSLAGKHGGPQRDQLAELSKLMREHPEDKIIIFAGHHPLGDWNEKTREAFFKLMSTVSSYAYISSHTHTGAWYEWSHGDPKHYIVELNTGSIVDWPIYYRKIDIYQGATDGVMYLHSPIYQFLDKFGKYPPFIGLYYSSEEQPLDKWHCSMTWQYGDKNMDEDARNYTPRLWPSAASVQNEQLDTLKNELMDFEALEHFDKNTVIQYPNWPDSPICRKNPVSCPYERISLEQQVKKIDNRETDYKNEPIKRTFDNLLEAVAHTSSATFVPPIAEEPSYRMCLAVHGAHIYGLHFNRDVVNKYPGSTEKKERKLLNSSQSNYQQEWAQLDIRK